MLLISIEEIPTNLSVGFISLLKQLIELREIFCLLDYQFIIKGLLKKIKQTKQNMTTAQNGITYAKPCVST